MKITIAVAIVLSLSVRVSGESISYQAVALLPDGSRKPLAMGTREYSPATDVEVAEAKSQGRIVFWSKAVFLFGTFLLDAHVTREKPTLQGFGLSLRQRDNPNGFSWEWFDREEGDVFLKLRATGRVRVVTATGPGYEELVAVEFLDNITLRFSDDMFRRQPGEHSHEVLIEKGSVFRVAP